MAAGKTAKEIGAELSIAESTVNWHVGNVLTKLSASSRAEAVAKAMRSGMLEGDASQVEPPAAPAAEPGIAVAAPFARATD